MVGFSSFLWPNNLLLFVCTPHFLYPFIRWWTCWLPLSWLLWITVQWTRDCMKMHVSYWVKCFHFLQINTQMWNCWIICYFSDILRALHTVFCSSCTNLHSHQLHRGSLFSISSPTAIYFLVIAILMGVRLCLTVGFFCISLMISDVRVFSCTCWPPVCFCWEIVYSDPLPIFFLSSCFF